MSAALTAGRALVDTVIVNAESPRNDATTASHGFLTRDGAHPSTLLAVAKEQLAKYETVHYVNDSVTATSNTDVGFEVTLTSGRRFRGERLVIATGHVDDLGRLGLPGIDDVYGTSVYPCVFCDGFEHRTERLALFATDVAVHYASIARLWTDDVIVFSNGADLSAEDTEALERNGVPTRTEPIRRLHSADGRLQAVELDSGERIERDAGFIGEDYSHPATTFAESLGVTSLPNEWGTTSLDVDEAGKSGVPGLHVIGDARTGFSGLIGAAAEGAACAEAIVHEIATERWEHQ